MDIATRKRVMSSNLDGPSAKVQASLHEPPSSFSDILFLNVLNGLNMTEPSQRLSFIEDIISRLQRLKQYCQECEPVAKKPTPSEKSPIGSPHQPEQHRPLDYQQMKKCIEKDREMLLNMTKLISISAQGPPFLPPGPPIQIPKILGPVPPPPPIVHVELKKTTTKTSEPSAAVTATISTSAPVNSQALTTTPVQLSKPRKIQEKKNHSPPSPQFPFHPARHFAQSAEEMMLDLQEKQRKLLSYISAAHGGKVTDEVLHDYLRHPFVLLKENGVVRKQQNPFYHLMAQNAINMKMMSPNPAVITKPENSKPTTPIPAPPILLPQVELPMKTDIKKEDSPPNDKVSPPPQLPLQVPFPMPVTRKCNQWSVVSMALPLRLLCRCYQTPCRCSQF